MPIAITDEQRALAASVRSWAATGGTDLSGLAGIGLFAVAVPEELGGAGGTVADLAAGVAETAAALVPGPVLSSLLAGLALARVPDSPVAKELLPALADGTARAAAAFGPGGLRGTRAPDGGLTVTGRSGPVLDADGDAHLLLAARVGEEDVWFVLPPGRARLSPGEPFDLSRAVGTAELTDVAVRPEALLPGVAVEDLAATLAAAEASGVAAWCLRTASEYAGVREQFGRPIGAFQAVKHLCAGMLCRAELAAALAWDAARAADDEPGQRALAAAVAAAGALDAAVDNAKDCIQVLGGIGFTWEQDAHRYLRRAVALRQLLGGSAHWRRRAGELVRSGARRDLGVDPSAHADATFTARVRAVCAELAALDPDHVRARLAETGYLVPHWPEPYGLGASPAQQLVIDAELDAAGVRRPDLVIGAWAAPTILRHGTAAQRDRFVGPTLRGEITWCQLFSEPGAGSDLAALRTRATRVPGGWRLTGQKVWTSLAHEADWAICLARTDPDAPKHRGITYFLVDMREPGIEIRPLREITGEARFNEVFLTDVFVPDELVVGEVHDGWRLARTTLANERVALGGGSAVGEAVEHLLATHPGLDAERLGALVVRGCAGSVLDLRATLLRLDGREPGAESSVRKLLGVWHRQDVAEVALDAFGPEGADAGGRAAGAQHEFLLTRCLSIAGGTTQVLLNVVAERLLGLPRE
ncbi:alkylation response protein AidB-like acyl-CoA dehydrogenase [Prauserella shujinwangii]|uniref:Alkylation response protein AidB-like acyl-CoA dehydrogenase n=1 Tax=Prauserella shujinwangii TaxID=1453103 RepID=A0A2T0M3A0_9PSEU|nr:acyl-CoA dehydrogenase [Prauserella shujinwangii]PRX51189.1 alkylation response protein AidB-like acyl-CoA dehydrogenase [Prauserella shujinwangii]